MEVLRCEEHYVFVSGHHSLWWNRITAQFHTKSAWDLSDIQDIECLGVTQAIVGQIEHDAYEPKLMIVKDCMPVGNLYDDHIIYKIKSICMLTMGSEEVELNLQPCKKHGNGSSTKRLPNSELAKTNKKDGSKGLFENSMFVNKTWGAVKSAGNTIKSTTQQAAAIATSQVKHTVGKVRDVKDRDKLEKRITEELHKIFDDTDSFYFCQTADVTSSLERLDKPEKGGPFWADADDRFFWNKHMLKDILDLGSPACDPWIIPVIQGHVKVRQCEVDASECSRHLNTESLRGKTEEYRELFTLSLISRRSRYRAGTRYKRRGVDENGNVANYVETEQCLVHRSHRVSFLQVRGSAPVYWSQPGLKYRPPPRLDRGEEETQIAFNKHFEQEKAIYGPVCIVNLVEQSGREKVIFDAFSDHIYTYNSPDLVYSTFDFHEYCRGMHFENVSVLISALMEIIAEMGYCWRDPQGYICRQNGVFRVNCIDCLDRTNVVQTAIGKAVLEMQVTRLGLSGPDWPLPVELRTALHDLWADNGDVISRQYAGTNALKGDYTRTGERKFTGIMKDGMNSANRYIIQHFSDSFRQCCIDLLQGHDFNVTELVDQLTLTRNLRTVGGIANAVLCPAILDIPPRHENIPPYYIQSLRTELIAAGLVYDLSSYYLSRFKDAFRQATIDLMLGESEVGETFFQQDAAESEDERHATAEHVKQLIEDCKKLLVSDPHNVVGAWGLIDADPGTGDPLETEMDSILILTRDNYVVADYDDQSDRVTKFQQQSLTDVTFIEFGVPESASQMSLTSLKSNLSLSGNRRANETAPCIRIHYQVDGQDGYFHMFRSTNLRFFNNMAIYIKTPEEINESLRSICECFLVAMDVSNIPRVPFKHDGKLDRKKSKVRPTSGRGGRSALYLELSGLPGITRNLSETQLVIKNVGSKALTNMTEQFSKLNKFGHNFNNRNKHAKSDNQSGLGKSSFIIGKTALKMTPKKYLKGSHSDCTSSDNSSDDEENKPSIFEPTLDNFEHCQQYVGNNPMLKSEGSDKAEATPTVIENLMDASISEAYLTENPLYSSKIDANTCSNDNDEDFLLGESQPIRLNMAPATSKTPDSSVGSFFHKLNPFNDNTQLMGSEYFDNVPSERSTTPEITIDFASNSKLEDNKSKAQPPSSLKLNQKLSHSSGEVDLNTISTGTSASSAGNDNTDASGLPVRSTSQHDMNLNISQSQSESALKQMKNMTSPVASAKDLVLSPFSKFAKGMQSLGANLDPRKIKNATMARQITEQQYEEHRKLQEKWEKCNTRLIAL